MEFIKMNLSKIRTYMYQDASNIPMNLLGNFLACDVACGIQSSPTYQDWIQDDSLGETISGNIISLEKEGNNIILGDMYSQKQTLVEAKLSCKQLIQLLDDWREKVCKIMPQYVMIKHENDQYTIETSETPFD